MMQEHVVACTLGAHFLSHHSQLRDDLRKCGVHDWTLAHVLPFAAAAWAAVIACKLMVTIMSWLASKLLHMAGSSVHGIAHMLVDAAHNFNSLGWLGWGAAAAVVLLVRCCRQDMWLHVRTLHWHMHCLHKAYQSRQERLHFRSSTLRGRRTHWCSCCFKGCGNAADYPDLVRTSILERNVGFTACKGMSKEPLSCADCCGAVQVLSAVLLCSVVPYWWWPILLFASIWCTRKALPVNSGAYLHVPAVLWVLTSMLRFSPWWVSAVTLGWICWCHQQTKQQAGQTGAHGAEVPAQGGLEGYVPLEQCAPPGADACVTVILNATNYFEVRNRMSSLLMSSCLS